MAIDPEMKEICQLFFQESTEGLDAMESGLLGLNCDPSRSAADPETMNRIFRAAHSIKGGAATFGFMEVSGFTHHVETLLDRMRNNEYPVTEEAIQLLLQSVDCIRSLVASLIEDAAPDMTRASALQRQLESLSAASAAPASPACAAVTAAAPALADSSWRIMFRPNTERFLSCNDPVLIMCELHRFGRVDVTANGADQLDFDRLDPETCQLWWQIDFTGKATREQIAEVFAWVEGDCELSISPAAMPTETAGPCDTPAQSDAVAADAAPAGSVAASASVPPEARVAPGTPPAVANKPATGRKPSQDIASIRVSTEKVDTLINLVGELVITQSMLDRFNDSFSMDDLDRLHDGLAQLTRTTRELQEHAMRIRMLPIRASFSRFPRLVHDLGRKLGKKIELKLSGEDTELDKTVLEKIADPLVHLVRNSIDHGIETPEVRAAAGKAETGTLTLRAYHESGMIVIDIIDDGAGINTGKVLAKARAAGIVAADEILSPEKIHHLIFQPGFSTAETVSDVSGRGVGLDVVKRNIADLSGHIHIESVEGHGSTFRIRLPLTLAILDGQLARVGGETYIIPLISILETLQVRRENISFIADRTELYRVRDKYLPIVRLSEHFHVPRNGTTATDGLLVIAEADGQRAGILVDDLLGQQQVVIKSLRTNYRTVPGFSGATILGDGTVALILDVPAVIRAARPPAGPATDTPAPPTSAQSTLAQSPPAPSMIARSSPATAATSLH